ncbi:MAG: PEP/pyruvate-binding domain-containing protein [Coriobacteriia bacterium]|nr:PEP/pyruvate-binding domain-containing protein [Coriobacteriia bacterium]
MVKRKDLSSGIPALDQVLEGVWAGDNIVLQVDDIADFLPFAHRYCEYTHAAGRKLVYFRFADHAPLLPEGLPAEVHELDPSAGFEQFISEILTVIDRNGHDAVYYLFDSLSGLAVDWYSDRMLGNFFRLTCPYLFDYDTVALFMLFRNVHTPLATRAIHTTAQIVLDIFRHTGELYVLPLKVWERRSPTMYMLHAWTGDEVRPVIQSVELAEIRTSMPQPWIDQSVEWRDPWTNAFAEAREVQARVDSGEATPGEIEAHTHRLIRMLLSRDESDDVFGLCVEHFELADLIAIGKRMVGTGQIGGKSVGMLLARKILMQKRPELTARLEVHDSFYVGSDVFYTYLVLNDCWWDRYRLKGANDLFERARELETRLCTGVVPPVVLAQFREILEYFGQSPVIVRSSSLLEDAYGNSFSGKYESVFCGNQGDPEERLEDFVAAVRTVYSSTMSKEALSYRLHRGLIHRDEQMALLVQRVSGEFHGDLYYPHIGGVGYSFNPYVWNKQIDPAQGMLRLVFGLGTRAVDRHDDDYTRVVALNAPMLRPEGSSDEIRSYSQRIANVIDLTENAHVSRSFQNVVTASPGLPLDMLASRDRALEQRARDAGMRDVFSQVLTFEGLLTGTPFPAEMHAMMSTIAEAYRHPVDIEFTVNFVGADDYRVNLLQCRPFHFVGELTHLPAPADIAPAAVLLKTSGPIIGHSMAIEIDRVVYVVPKRYSTLSTADRFSVAALVGRVTNLPGKKRHIALVGPGRWGTRMPELGVPATLSQIKNATVLAEVAEMHAGLTPDLSLGTHFFNDLVDLDILYMGITPGSAEGLLNADLLERLPNALDRLLPEARDQRDLLRVIDAEDLDGRSIWLWADVLEQRAVLFISDRCEVPQE